MDIPWDTSPAKPIGKDRKKGRDIEEYDNRDVRATSAQGFGSGISGREVEHSSEYVNVGNSDKDDVQASGE